MSESFDADWLALREGFDAAARSAALAAALRAALPASPTIIDLGAGTGSLFRWLAPRLNGPQSWLLADADGGLLQAGLDRIAFWAEQRGWAVSAQGMDVIRVHAPGGPWRVQVIEADLAAFPAGLPLARVDAVVCSALLDIVSRDWLERVAGAVRVPFFASLSVNGHDRFSPAHPADRLVSRAFAADQQREKGLGRALGAAAPAAARAAFAAAGFRVMSAATPWRIARHARAMLTELTHGHADAAIRARPLHAAAIAAWETHRLARIGRAGFAMTIGHTDVLALPG